MNKMKQLDFIGEDWININPRKNRAVLFLRTYPFEEKFKNLKERFESMRVDYLRSLDRERREKKNKHLPKFNFYESLKVNGSKEGRLSFAGREPFDFFALLRLLACGNLLGQTKITDIYERISTDEVLKKECRFTDKFPSYDTAARFDRLMSLFGLWRQYRKITVKDNVEKGLIKLDGKLVVDGVHSEGNGKVNRMVKKCRDCHDGSIDIDCPRRINGRPCDTPKLTDDMMGIVHKNDGKVIKAVEYQIGGATNEIPYGVFAFNGSENEGSESFERFLRELSQDYPWLEVKKLYVDGIYNTRGNRELAEEIFGAELISKPNPRNRSQKSIERKGIKFTIDKWGKVTCEEGKELVYKGREIILGRYIFVIKDNTNCLYCSKREKCCPGAKHGKSLRIEKELLSQFNWEKPELGIRYKKDFDVRTTIERIISRAKDVLGFGKQYKRGRINVQGFGDRVVALMNQIAYCALLLDNLDGYRSLKNFIPVGYG